MTDSTEQQLPPEAESSRYRPIKRLDESVVNRIAAGEIIHRPANALKELIENSLDAGSTLIRITLKEGGIKMLQIQDNGSGIQPSDLPLLCERFATSKLRDFGDLESMSTFGFRGEALASISYVTASMNVVSKTRHQDCAYRAYYANGSLASPKPGQSSDPKQCAGTDGTLITAEDLFYNVPQRRRALRSAADEYNRALDVVSKYAVHYGGKGVGFVCRKASSNATDLNTPSSPTNSTLDTIRILHGNTVARELVELKDVVDDNLGFQCQGWISGANWSSKRTTLLCFINNRLVDCPLLKRSIEALYATLLPKGGHPWVYLSISINPANVDVNVHPTKKEVHFLHEDEIVEHICQAAGNRLAGANSSRTFAFSQAVLPILAPDAGVIATSSNVASRPDEQTSRPSLGETKSSSSSNSRAASGSSSPAHVVRTSESSGPVSSSKGYPQHLVRVDAKTRTLDAMFASSSKTNGKKRALDAEGHESSSIPDVLMADTAAEEDESESASHRRAAMQSSDPFADSNGGGSSSLASMVRRSRQALSVRIPDSDCSLASVRHLRAQITKAQHRNLTDVVQNHTFVGVVDLDKGLSLIQHETRLLLVNHDAMIREFAYQLVLRQFGSLKRVRLDPAPKLDDLIRLGLENTTGVPEDDTESIEATKDKIANLLLENAEMLEEYFSICLDAEKRTMEALPNLLPGGGGANGSAIELDRLPQLLVRLATRVDWQDEQECFETFARQLAWSCLPCPPLPPPRLPSPSSSSSGAMVQEKEEEKAKEARQEREAEVETAKKRVQHLWFDSMAKSRGKYVPSKATNEFVVQVANLPDLYRVFERC
nr:mismatch repair protein [Sporisorium sorghi]